MVVTSLTGVLSGIRFELNFYFIIKKIDIQEMTMYYKIWMGYYDWIEIPARTCVRSSREGTVLRCSVNREAVNGLAGACGMHEFNAQEMQDQFLK